MKKYKKLILSWFYGAETVQMVKDFSRSSFIHPYLNKVEAVRNIFIGEYFPQEFLCAEAYSFNLFRAQISTRWSCLWGYSFGFDLNEDEHKTVAGDDIQFPLAFFPVPAYYGEPFTFQHFRGIFFTDSAEADMCGSAETEMAFQFTVYLHFPGAEPEQW